VVKPTMTILVAFAREGLSLVTACLVAELSAAEPGAKPATKTLTAAAVVLTPSLLGLGCGDAMTTGPLLGVAIGVGLGVGVAVGVETATGVAGSEGVTGAETVEVLDGVGVGVGVGLGVDDPAQSAGRPEVESDALKSAWPRLLKQLATDE
jgi:hypothetical protein